jgi:TonB-linked SusC/RagA family outer membrane protein
MITSVTAQNVITGKVVDEENNALIGVSVIIQGTSNGTVTNLEGEFQLPVKDPAETTLYFSYIGYIPKTIEVNGRSTINVQMELNIEELGEVVVIGYGTQKKSDLTGALSSVSSKDIEDLPALGIEQALQGKAAGVEVINNSGAPGSSVTVRIRGMGTLNAGSQPLYVVDGFIMGDQAFGKEGGNVPDNKMGINFLNPNDIESIEILKDASAAAIYGARGANGVVLITTKKGKSGEAKVDMEIFRGVQTLYKKYDILNAEEFRGYVDDFVQARGAYPGYDPERGIEDRTDWIDQVVDNAAIESYNLAVSGGNDNATYRISTNYFNQDGLIPAADFNRISIRLNSTQKLNDRINTGQSLIFARSIRNRVANEGQILSNALIADPSAAVYNEDGDWNELLLTSQAGNPVGVLDRNNYTYESYRYFGNAFMDIKLFDGLTSNTRAGIDINEGDLEAFRPRYEISPSDRQDQNIFSVRNERWINWDFESTLRYDKSFGKHNLNVVAGITAQKESFIDTRLTFIGFPFDEDFMRYPNLPNPDGIVSEVGSSPMEYSVISLLSRVQYSYDDKWLLTASIRRDGSSKFGPNNRYGNFPSASLGYRFSEEKFMQNIPFIADSKLRVGWGQLGNQSIPPYAYSTTVSNAANYTVGNNEIVTGSLPNGVVNESIRWETATQTNVGLDVALFDFQLQFNIDAFYKLTSDMLLPLPIPSFTGIHNVDRVGGEAPFAFGNAGEMETRGLEFAMTYKYVKNDFSLTASGNVSFVRNEILSLAGTSAIPSNIVNSVPASRTEVGSSVAAFYGYQIEGIFQSYDEIAAHAVQGPEDPHIADPNIAPNPRQFIAPGDFKFRDINGDGIINDDDRTFIGDPLPDFTYGTNLKATYKNFDLALSLIGVQGNDIINGMTFFLRGYSLTNKSREVLDAWTPENTNTDQPRLGVNRNNNMRFSDFWVLDGSYLRLQNVTLGYNLPQKLLGNTFFDRVRLYATVQNLFTLTNYPGMEPEVGSSIGFNADPLDFGLDNATFPQPRTFIGGVNISF